MRIVECGFEELLVSWNIVDTLDMGGCAWVLFVVWDIYWSPTSSTSVDVW